MTKTIKPDDI